MARELRWIGVALLAAACQGNDTGSARVPVHRGRAPNDYPELAATAVTVFRDESGEVRPFCTATLIARRALISAAHCFGEDAPRGLRVAFGLEGATGAGSIGLARAPLLEPGGNDLAILLLQEDAPAGHRPVPILDPASPLREGEVTSVAGYGEDENREAGRLSAVDGAVAELWRRREQITDFTMRHSRSGPCYGDSGGPAYLYRDGAAFLVGAVVGPADEESDCARGQERYTYVPRYLDWIRQHVELSASGTAGEPGTGALMTATARANDIDGDGVADGAHLRGAARMLAELAAAEQCLVAPGETFQFRLRARLHQFWHVELERPTPSCPAWRQGFVYRPHFTIETAAE
jgi:secreted trypsin-like serine protease